MRLEYFQMVDRITELDVAGGRIVVASQVPEQSPVFEGHFPGYPILPDGTYTAILRSSAATDGFQALNPGGGFLDGHATGVIDRSGQLFSPDAPIRLTSEG